MLEILFQDLMIVEAIPVVSGQVQYLNFICMILGGAQSRYNTEAVIFQTDQTTHGPCH
jgi:hypothetical protein